MPKTTCDTPSDPPALRATPSSSSRRGASSAGFFSTRTSCRSRGSVPRAAERGSSKRKSRSKREPRSHEATKPRKHEATRTRKHERQSTAEHAEHAEPFCQAIRLLIGLLRRPAAESFGRISEPLSL